MVTDETVLFKRQKKNKKETVPLVLVNEGKGDRPIKATDVSPVLLRIKGSWPLDLYPDELIIEEKKIVLKSNTFPFFSTVSTFPLKQINFFDVSHALIFSSISIRGNTTSVPSKINWIKPQDAQKAKELVDGLMMKEKEKIIVMNKDTKQMATALTMMGQM